MSDTPRQLEAILEVLGLKPETLFAEGREAGKDRDKVMAWLYRVLDTLDNKTAQLLRFAALLLAAETFLAQVIVRNDKTPLWISFWVLILLLVPLWAGIMGLTVFAVEWRFFGHVRGPGEPATWGHRKVVKPLSRLFSRVRQDSAENMPSNGIEHEMWELARVCDKRVDANSRTFVLCLLSALGFIVTLGAALAGIALYGAHP